MRKPYILIIIIILLSTFFELLAQNPKIDSVLSEIKKIEQDSSKVLELNTIALQSAATDNDNAMILAEKALKIGIDSKYQNGIALVYKTIGIIYYYRGETEKAFENFYKSLDTYKESGDKSGVARSYVNIGIIYRSKQDYTNALKNYSSAIEVFKETNDKEGIAITYLNIGNIYNKQGNHKYAIENYLKARQFFEETKNKQKIALTYSNIGAIHADRKEEKEALDYFNKALKIYTNLEDTLGMADINNNIGFIYLEGKKTDNVKALNYFKKCLELYTVTELPIKLALTYYNLGDANNNLGNYDEAFQNYTKSLEFYEKLEDDTGKALCFNGIGEYHLNKKNYSKAITYLEESKKLIGNSDLEVLKKSAELLSSAYSNNGDYKNALENQIIFKNMNDSIFSQKNEKEITSLSMQYEFDKQQKIDEIAHNEELKRQRIITWAFTFGLALMIIIAIISVRGYRRKIKANKLLSAQKEEIQFKNVELEQQKEEIETQRDEIEDINTITEKRNYRQYNLRTQDSKSYFTFAKNS